MALTWAGGACAAILAGAPWVLYVRRYLDVPYALVLFVNFMPALLAVSIVIVMLQHSPRRTLSAFMRLKGVLWFIGAWFAVDTLTALKAGLSALDFVRLAWFPLISLSFALLGLAAARHERIPLITAAAGSALGAIGGALGYAAYRGIRLAPVAVYSGIASSVGAWAPAGGEGFRAVGFDLDPNYFALLGVVALAFSLSHRGDLRVRSIAAVAGVAVVLLSGSRMGALALPAIAAAWMLGVLVNKEDRTTAFKRGLPVIAAVLLVVSLALVGAAITGAPMTVAVRLTESGQWLSDSTSTLSALDSMSDARLSKWVEAFKLYQQQPLGSFAPPGEALGFSTHNQYLDNLIQGGPLFLIAYVAFIIWLGMRRPRGAPTAALTLAVAYAVTSLVLTTSYMAEIISMFFFLTGWLAGRSENERARIASNGTFAAAEVMLPELETS